MAALAGIPLDIEMEVRPLARQVDGLRAIISKDKRPCRSYLQLPATGGVRERLRTVRCWRVPARRILEMGRLARLP